MRAGDRQPEEVADPGRRTADRYQERRIVEPGEVAKVDESG
jgi:hypothetical protein